MEPLLEIDGDVRSFEVFLSSRMPVLAARDVEMFLPCTVNLDPKLREIIAGLCDHSDHLCTRLERARQNEVLMCLQWLSRASETLPYLVR